MASMNKVILMGRLGKAPELRYTANQIPVASMTLATSDIWTDKSGQKQEETQWHRVILWGSQAQASAKFLVKGQAVLVEGKMQTRQWEDKQKVKHYTTEIVAQRIQFLSKPAGVMGAGKMADIPPLPESVPSQDSPDNLENDIPF